MHVRLFLVPAVLVATTLVARADATSQAGYTVTLSREVAAERITGGGVGLYGDVVGIGILLDVDYQNVPKREEGAVLHGHTVAFGMGFRFSPISMMNNPRLLHYFDVYGVAGFQGGVAYRDGRFGQRNSTYTAVGAQIRAGDGGPGIVVERQWRNPDDKPGRFQHDDAVVVGLSFAWSSKGPLRD